jgi:predicted amidophosphoribosyltransferase
MHLSTQVREEKLAKLLAAEGYDTLEELAAAVLSDSASPAICIECDAAAEMEPDQDTGYCENCGKNAVVAALVLAELI